MYSNNIIQELDEMIHELVIKLWPETKDIVVRLGVTDPKRGDLSTNISFAVAKAVDDSPQKVAETIARELKGQKLIDHVDAENGFVNMVLGAQVLAKQLDSILSEKGEYGRSEIHKDKKARVEFISANPTGPLHIGNARGGPMGDSIANVLEGVGYKVLREYLNNDKGNQVYELGKTLASKAGLIKTQGELAYNAPYTDELGQKIKTMADKIAGRPEDEIIRKAGEIGVTIEFEQIINDAKAMGITFDHIAHESELQKSIPEILDFLNQKGLLKQYEGATWFAPKQTPNEFFKDKEAVVVKSDGSYLYFTSDLVYHKEKFESDYDLIVDVLGSNTLAEALKLQAFAKELNALERFRIVYYQYVRVKRGKEVIKMSKRAGNFVTAKEVLDEVGKDAFRFFMLMHDANTHMDFDLELAKKRSHENPVYYVQYAAVRAKAIIKKSQIPNPKSQTNSKTQITNTKQTQIDRRLIVHLSLFPRLIEEISQNLKVHQLTRYAVETAQLFHDFYEKLPVIEQGNVNIQRLKIVKTTLIVLENTLTLLGVSVPDHM